MIRRRNIYRSRYRLRNGRRRSRKKSIVGSMLLELIAIITLVIVSAAKYDNETSPSQPKDLTAQRTAEFGSMIAGFLSDQWDRNQLNFRR